MPRGIQPNDPRRTARVVLFQEHYAALGDELYWDVDRYRKLCAALQLTPYELGAMVRAQIGHVERWLSTGQFPPAVELHLTLIERAFYPSSKKPIFPSCC